MTPDLIRERALELYGATLPESRAAELAAEIERIVDAADAAREKLDFNDEPARFAALLAAHAGPRRPR